MQSSRDEAQKASKPDSEPPELEFELDQSHGWQYDVDRDLKKEIYESQWKRSHAPHELLKNIVYDDDYTESTCSTGSSDGSISKSASVESIEQFINSVRSAATTTVNVTNTRSGVNDELETYHPRMEGRALSPYRTPEPGQATINLNKPVPLPDPNTKPKSILKRRTSNGNSVIEATNIVEKSEDVLEESQLQSQIQTSSKPQPQLQLQSQLQTQPQSQQQQQPKSLPSISKPEKEKRSFLNLFSRKATSTDNLKKPVESPEKATESEKQKLSKQRQNSIEENKVEQVAVIDHYSDIVKELGGKVHSKGSLHVCMKNQALREVAAKVQQDEHKLLLKQQNEQVRHMLPEPNKINIYDDTDEQHMLEVAKKMNLYTESNEYSTDCKTLSPPKNDLVEISVEHTKSVSYAVRQINKPDVKTNKETTFQANSKCLIESTKLCNDVERNDSVIDTKRQETLTEHRSSSSPLQYERRTVSEQCSQFKSPVSERKTSLSSTILKVTRMPIQKNDIEIDLDAFSQSPTPEPRCTTAEKMETVAQLKVCSTLSYAIDLVMFSLACYLYVFRDAPFSIPILILMVYRQVKK